MKRSFIKRRAFLRNLSQGAVASTFLTSAPYIIAKPKIKLRVMGTHVTLQEELRQRAQKDLGFEINFEAAGSAAVLHKASTQPESFDLYEQWSNSINVLWQAEAIQPIDISRLTHWNEINNITKTGRIVPEAKIGYGDAPYKLLYVQDDETLDSSPTNAISFLPYVHNVDSFGYNSDVIPRGKAYETESWSWLFDEKYKGKVALINAPTIGLFDAALAAQSLGLIKFKNIGNMTRAEVDAFFDILIDLKKQGHFRGFWNSVPESIHFMKNHEVIIQSMFSPAVSSLNGQSVPCISAAPKEGYRAWHGVMCLSRSTTDYVKDAAYDYMNWWLSGWPGAFIARQGYYISNPERSRPLLSNHEWDYWYDGKPAEVPLKGTHGKISVQGGSVRNGGSYTKRFSNVAVWNTVMDTYEYTLMRWGEFISR
ncbi:MAG: extracellular solute-binding protein [Verrucomicrobiota bacterium]